MAQAVCIICTQNFYVKPSHLKIGWGKYCSKACQYQGQKTGELKTCNNCQKTIYRNKRGLRQSKSGYFFCSKSCQTSWRNTQYRGEKHKNWINGKSSYRSALIRSDLEYKCLRCKISDSRLLAVHHKDKDRSNNDLSNLIWLCHNCHYLVHHDKTEAEGFVVPIA
jgi:hypothetical protein